MERPIKKLFHSGFIRLMYVYSQSIAMALEEFDDGNWHSKAIVAGHIWVLMLVIPSLSR